MWQRRTYHECAEELAAISEDFRAAHTNRHGWDLAQRRRVINSTSVSGVELLLVLALSIRSDQDYGLTKGNAEPVGAFRAKATEDEVAAAIKGYQLPYDRLKGFSPLALRQALNKIAHADPKRNSYFANEQTHDLILTVVDRGEKWIAVISLIDLCRVIKSLPDAGVRR